MASKGTCVVVTTTQVPELFNISHPYIAKPVVRDVDRTIIELYSRIAQSRSGAEVVSPSAG